MKQNTKAKDEWNGSQTILPVEDEDSLRELTRDLLVNCGHTVLEACDAAEALEIARQTPRGHIHLLFTDVVMPLVSGPKLADRFTAIHPDATVLFMSGYAEFAAGHEQISCQGLLLQKPFTRKELAKKVQEALESSMWQ